MPLKSIPVLQAPCPLMQDNVQKHWDEIRSLTEKVYFTSQDLRKYGIECFPFAMDNEHKPAFYPHFFKPLTRDTLRRHPIDEERLKRDMKEDLYILHYNDFDAEAAKNLSRLDLHKKMALSPQECTQEIWNMIDSHISSVPRMNMPKHSSTLENITGWTRAIGGMEQREGDINPLLGEMEGFMGDGWSTEYIQEWKNSKVPHLVMVVCHNIVGTDELMSGELMPILRGMRICLNQAEFKRHNQAPVLMLSLNGPKKGRLLHAHIEETLGLLVIQCSSYYDFERKDTAPFELFYCYCLSTPVEVKEPQKKPGGLFD